MTNDELHVVIGASARARMRKRLRKMPHRSYIKIYGPPLLRAMKALEKIIVGTQEVPADLSRERVGLYDFHFEWVSEPDSSQFHRLMEMIDDALSPLGVWYTITTVHF